MSKPDQTPEEQAKEHTRNLKQGIYVLQQTFEFQVELLKQSNKLLRARYESLVEVGFTAQEALVIICQRGSTP